MAGDYILNPTELMQANYEKYKDKFVDSSADLVNSETFINLLVAEMTNQDPLEPTSNTEFITQMAQFSQLQYMQDTSKYSVASYASSLVGKTVTATKAEGKDVIVKTGVVEQVIKNGDSYTVIVDGTSFSLSNITSVSDTAPGSGNLPGGSTGSALGDAIARASMMIGMYATVSAETESGNVMDAGVITSIEVKDGVINVIINGVAYKVEDIVELTYAIYDDGTGGEEDPGVDGDETVDGVDGAEGNEGVTGDEDTETDGTDTVPDVDGDEVIPDTDDEELIEVREQLAADRFVDDVQDLEF